jgi:hypothetical protein
MKIISKKDSKMKQRKLHAQSPVCEIRISWSKRFKKVFWIESKLERDYFNYLLFTTDVIDVECQPEAFTICFNDKKRRYTPDFRVTYSDRIEIIEIKYEEELNKIEFLEKAVFLKAYFEQKNLVFRVITESTIRVGSRAINYQKLKSALLYEPPEQEFEQLKQSLPTGNLSNTELSQHLASISIKNGFIQRALAHNLLSADLSAPWAKLQISWSN